VLEDKKDMLYCVHIFFEKKNLFLVVVVLEGISVLLSTRIYATKVCAHNNAPLQLPDVRILTIVHNYETKKKRNIFFTLKDSE
jgi:hypothetical protein